MTGCSGSTENVAFKGVWNVEKLNGISGDKTESVETVAVSRNKFRISSLDPDGESIDSFDGKVLRHRTVPVQNPDALIPMAAPVNTSEPKSDLQLETKRFWKQSFNGTGMAGGQIAGRDTLLFQGREKMMDGEMTMQAWVDAETRVVLKKIFTIYSSQVDQVVSRTTEECREIQYGPEDDAVFNQLQ